MGDVNLFLRESLASEKNEIIRVFVLRKGRSQLALTRDQRTRHVSAFTPPAVGLLDSPKNQGANRTAQLLRLTAERIVQGLWDVDCRPYVHLYYQPTSLKEQDDLAWTQEAVEATASAAQAHVP